MDKQYAMSWDFYFRFPEGDFSVPPLFQESILTQSNNGRVTPLSPAIQIHTNFVYMFQMSLCCSEACSFTSAPLDIIRLTIIVYIHQSVSGLHLKVYLAEFLHFIRVRAV